MNTTQTNLLWVDGDGSTRFYRRVGSTNTWMSAKDDGQDSITFASNQYTRTTRHGVQVIFDSTGRHIQTKNRAGQVTSFAWLNATELDSVLLPPSGSGKAFKLQYATGGRLSGVRLEATAGRNIVDTVDASSGAAQLTSWVWPDGTKMRFSYNGGHRLTKSIFSGQDSLALVYDTLALVKQSTVYYHDTHNTALTSVTKITPWQELGFGIAGGSSVAAADTSTVVTTVNGPPADSGRIAVFHIDQWGAPIAEKDAYGYVTSYVRADPNAPGLVSAIQFPNSRTASMKYNTQGNITRLADSSWGAAAFPTQITTWVYGDSVDDIDSPTQVRAPDSTLTTYTYNALGLTATVTDPRSHVTAFTYNTSGSLEGQLTGVTEQSVSAWIQGLQVDSVKNLVTSLSYSTLGNTTEVDDPAGGATKYTQDADGRLISTINPLGFVQHHNYDAMDRDTLRVLLHASGGVSTGCHTNQFTCDSTLILTALNPAGGDSEITRFAYTLGRLTKVTDPRSVLHQYAYDERGLLLRDIDEQSRADSMTYDAAGQMVARTTRNGDVLTFSYDSLGRETRWVMPTKSTYMYTAPFAAPADTVVSSYDVVGNLLYHGNRLGDITRTYLSNGLEHTEVRHSGTRLDGHLVPDSVMMGYDRFGRLDSLSWRGNDRVRYTYLATGDLGKVYTDWKNGTGVRHDSVTFAWDSMGRRRQVQYPFFSMSATSHYDVLGTLRMLRVQNNAAGVPNRFQDSLVQDQVDVLGRPVHQKMFCRGFTSTDPGNPCGDWLAAEQTTRYNRVGQIATQVIVNAAGLTATDTFRYDLSGNRTSLHDRNIPTVLSTLTYPAASNRVQVKIDTIVSDTNVVANRHYAYDSLGGRWFEYDINPDRDSVVRQIYQYDAAGRMAGSAQGSDAYPQTTKIGPNTCGYDADGRAVVPCGAGGVSLLGDNVIHDPNGNWFYVYGPGLDEPLLAVHRNPVDTTELARLDMVSTGRGQVLAIGDSAGGLNSAYAYAIPGSNGGPWGSGIATRAQTFNPRRWATVEQSDTISTFRTRQYDPATGKWLQEDPIGLAGGVNLYEYNGNDPNTFSDPVGLDPCKGSSAWTECLAQAVANWGASKGGTLGALALNVGAAANAVLEATGINAAASSGNAIASGHPVSGLAQAALLVGSGGIARGLGGASDGLAALFAKGGGLADETIIGVRSTLLDNGFTQGLSENRKGYLFRNAAGEQVRIMRSGDQWQLRIRNKAGNYLDVNGNPAANETTHLLIGNQ